MTPRHRPGLVQQRVQIVASHDLTLVVGRSRYAEKAHLAAPRIILHDHAFAYEGVILHNFVEIRQHEHSIIIAL